MNLTTHTARQTLAGELVRHLLAAPYRTLGIVDSTGLEVDDLAGDARQILAGCLAWRDILPTITSLPTDPREGITLNARRRSYLVRAVCESLALAGFMRFRHTPKAVWTQEMVISAVSEAALRRPFPADTVRAICETLRDLAREEAHHAS